MASRSHRPCRGCLAAEGERRGRSDGPLPAGALAVLAPRPAAWPSLAFLQFLLGPANAALASHLLLGILDPADELVARQGRDVFPGIERGPVGDQRLAQVGGQLVHHAARHSLAAHALRGTRSQALLVRQVTSPLAAVAPAANPSNRRCA